MKKIIFAALLVPSIAFADGGRAVAQSASKHSSDFYVRADIGGEKLVTKTYLGGSFDHKHTGKVKPTYNIGAGYIFDEYFRADLNLRYNKASSDFKSFALLLNGYVDLPNSTMFSPYVTAGVGAAKNKVSHEALKVNKTVFAYTAGLGVRTKIQDNLSADLGYRYNNLGDVKGTVSGVAVKVKQHSNEIRLGLMYAF